MAILKQIKPGLWWHETPGFLFAACFCFFSLLASPAVADEPMASEYQVKAAFLVNFPKYVEWPEGAFVKNDSPIVIGVLGETKVADELQKIIADRTVNGRKFILKRLDTVEESNVCLILFISAEKQYHSPDLLLKLKNLSVLTVGESDDFLESGGIINLARRERKIALEVNLDAAANARIKISSKLLNVAGVVKGKSN